MAKAMADEAAGESSESLSKSEKDMQTINALYEKQKQYEAILAKYNMAGAGGDSDEDSVTISKSQ